MLGLHTTAERWNCPLHYLAVLCRRLILPLAGRPSIPSSTWQSCLSSSCLIHVYVLKVQKHKQRSNSSGLLYFLSLSALHNYLPILGEGHLRRNSGGLYKWRGWAAVKVRVAQWALQLCSYAVMQLGYYFSMLPPRAAHRLHLFIPSLIRRWRLPLFLNW